jgi:hypothetical protein
VAQSKDDPQISLAYDLHVTPKLETFNAFFRVPKHYRALEGSLTQLKRYSVPPRLFSVWDEFVPDQCYAYNLANDHPNSSIAVSCDFQDSRQNFDNLVSVFLTTALIGILISIAWDCAKAIDENKQVLGIDSSHLFLAAFASVIFLVVVGVQIYVGRTARKMLLVLGAIGPIILSAKPDSDSGAVLVLALAMTILCWLFVVRWRAVAWIDDAISNAVESWRDKMRRRYEVLSWIRRGER